jgi:hypothetical protein
VWTLMRDGTSLGLGYLMTGTLRFHCESTCYYPNDFVGSDMPGGVFTFDSRPSVHTG